MGDDLHDAEESFMRNMADHFGYGELPKKIPDYTKNMVGPLWFWDDSTQRLWMLRPFYCWVDLDIRNKIPKWRCDTCYKSRCECLDRDPWFNMSENKLRQPNNGPYR